MIVLMRTTIVMDDNLLRDARQAAARTGRTLSGVIADALREVLSRTARPAKAVPVRLPTVGGNGVRPGVNLDSNAALLDLMERDHVAR